MLIKNKINYSEIAEMANFDIDIIKTILSSLDNAELRVT